MNIKENMSNQEKQQCICELREALDKLENELKRDEAAESVAQHEAINHLDEYFNVVETKFQSLREFWQSLRDELKQQNKKSEEA